MHKIFRKTRELLKSKLIDIGPADNTIILVGMGRSGTTWAANIINHDNSYRVLFEPFFPQVVKEANKFDYFHYIPPHCNNDELLKQARNILSGKVSNSWVDRDNKNILYRRRIIKDIRCNLMLGWLKNKFPQIPLILIIRHPLQVTASWMKLGWGKEPIGNRSDFEIITSQNDLMRDFPIIEEMKQIINPMNAFESIVFEWCVNHLVPSKHLKGSDAYIVYYENLLINTEEEVKCLFKLLDIPYQNDIVNEVSLLSSSTNFQNRNFVNDHSQILASWKEIFTTKQIEKANNILKTFELDTLYDEFGLPTNAKFLA